MPLIAFRARSSFVWKVVLAAALVVVGDWLFYRAELFGGYIGLYAAILLAALLAASHAVRRDPRAWLPLAAASLFAGALVYDTSLLAWCLFWVSATLAGLLPATARFGDGWQWFQRLTWQGLRALVAPVVDLKRASKAGRRARSSRAGLRTILQVIALPLLGSIVILVLFAAANPVLEQALSSVVLPDARLLSPLRIALWIALSVTVWSLLRPRLSLNTLPTFDGRGDLPLPGVSVASVLLSLVAFNLLFALQNLLDLAYFSGSAAMPHDMTMAQYAHRGAYPLIATALLAAAFVLVTLRPGSATASVPAVRRLVVLWIGQNLLLVAFSIQRTIDYVKSYSLTELRIAALAWMALVAFGLVAICWRMLRDRSAGWLINANMAAAALLLALASFVDLGAVAAAWNVRHAREVGGRGVELDLCYLDSLGDSALLSLIALEQRDDLGPAFRERVKAVRERRLDALRREVHEGGWTMVGQSRLDEAQARLPGTRRVPLEPGARGCNGAFDHLPAQTRPESPNQRGAHAQPASRQVPVPLVVPPAPDPALTREAAK